MSLKGVSGRIIVRANKSQKNAYTFSNGIEIIVERDMNNLDRSYTQQTFGVVVDAEHIPKDALILFHFNALNETNKVHNHTFLSGKEIASGVEVYSIPESHCYLWKIAGEREWSPCYSFEIAERVFEPYKGVLQGIEPKKLPDTLYVKTGDLNGQVVKTLKACDAVLHFRNEKGVDESIIRFRPYGSDIDNREPEAIALLHDETKKVKQGKLLVGLTPADCISIKEIIYAD